MGIALNNRKRLRVASDRTVACDLDTVRPVLGTRT